MAVVAGVVFFTVRALLALIPALAAGAPIKKWSAAAALAAAAFYLLLSGNDVAPVLVLSGWQILNIRRSGRVVAG